MLNKKEVIDCLSAVGFVPRYGKVPPHRTIYETANRDFAIDFASYPGGRSEDVPLSVIRELEALDLIVPAFPDSPKTCAWILKSEAAK